nr:LPXTG cell wall anchor domain-containing protein [Enterococcus rivorum]
MSNDELIAVLKQLNEIGDGPFGGGRILNIISRIDKGLPKDTSTSSSIATSTEAKSSVSTTNSTQVDSKKKDGDLPKTGEEKAKMAVTIIGVVLVLGVIVLLIVRRNKKNK